MQIKKTTNSRKYKTNFYISTVVSTKCLHLNKYMFSDVAHAYQHICY